jgi:hypothetical protein
VSAPDIRPTEFTLVPSHDGETSDLVQVTRAFDDEQHKAGRVLLFVSEIDEGERWYIGAHLTLAELEALVESARKILGGAS